MARPFPRSFYDRDAATVAQELLGKWIVCKWKGGERIGKIVETEAYLGSHDKAAHSAKGRTKRTEVMFGPPGHAYVYIIYGIYNCLNVVTEEEGRASAVLIRALEPVKGIVKNTKGPGLLCAALGITRTENGHDLVSKDFFICKPAHAESFTVVRKSRIGVDYAGHWAKRLLRFYVKGNPWVSKK